MRDISCTTNECKWHDGNTNCSNNRLLAQLRTGAVSSLSCTGPDCNGYSKRD